MLGPLFDLIAVGIGQNVPNFGSAFPFRCVVRPARLLL